MLAADDLLTLEFFRISGAATEWYGTWNPLLSHYRLGLL